MVVFVFQIFVCVFDFSIFVMFFLILFCLFHFLFYFFCEKNPTCTINFSFSLTDHCKTQNGFLD